MKNAPDHETARRKAEGREPGDLARDPAEDELETDATIPDPENAFLERDDTHYREEGRSE